MKWPFQKTETKSSISEAQLLHTEQHDYPSREWANFAKEGYQQNPTIFRCISLIATNAASIAPQVKVNGEVVENHQLINLLRRPNVDCGAKEFFIEAYSWALLTGNLFTEKTKVGKQVRELWNWQPYLFSIDRSSANPRIPAAYHWNKNGKKSRRWEVDPITGKSDMMHWGLFNPSQDDAFKGMSPMEPAASAGDQLNASNKWRYNLFKNDCRPSGILSTDLPVTSSDEKTLSQRLIEKAKSKFLILGGGLKWTQLALSPKDADFLEGSKYNKQEICEAFGVPTQLMGIEGSQTFANMEQAVLHLYNQTVLPLVDLYYSELSRWFTEDFGPIEICYNPDTIKALEPERRETLKMRLESPDLTVNEKRELLGYERIDEPDADTLFIDPNKLPMGMEVFTPDEMQAQQAAKSMMRIGMSRDEAETKALEMFGESKCHAPNA